MPLDRVPDALFEQAERALVVLLPPRTWRAVRALAARRRAMPALVAAQLIAESLRQPKGDSTRRTPRGRGRQQRDDVSTTR